MTYARPVPKGAAFSQISTKTGKGRDTREKARAKHVEEAECRPAFGSLPALNHSLVADANAHFTCATCRQSWAVLDALLRRTA